VERVWLPKDHIYRKIVKEENTGLSKAIADNHREQTASDIHGYRKRQ
jgi:hypothetical protein